MSSNVNYYDDELKIPLLITKLNVIKKNNDISLELRKQKISEREKDIIINKKKWHTPRSLSKEFLKSKSEKSFSPNNSVYNSVDNNRRIKAPIITPKVGLRKVIKKNMSIIMNRTTPKFMVMSPKLSTKLVLDSKRMKKSNSPFNLSNANNYNVMNIMKGLSNSQRCSLVQRTPHERTLRERVYKISDLFDISLSKIKRMKKDIDLKQYQKSLINLGMTTFSKESVTKLDKSFYKIRKDNKVNIPNNVRFLKRVELKEERIIKKINKNNEKAKNILCLLNMKPKKDELKKLTFTKVVN